MPRPGRHRLLTAFLAVALALFAWLPASAGAPTDRLRDFFTKVNAVIADPTTADQPLERVVRIRRLVTDVTDMHAASATALGAEWKMRTASERDEFIGLFADLLERAYVGRLAGAVRVTGSVAMTYLDESVAGDEATVRTTLRGLGGRDMRVEYHMTADGGRWRVRDIVLDGVSTVENYRAQFRRMLQHDSWAALVKALHAKLAEESLMFAKLERRAPAPAPAPVVAATVEPDVTVPPRAPDVVAPPRTSVARAKPVPAVRVVERFAATPVALPAPVAVAASVAAPVAVAMQAPPPVIDVPMGEPSATGSALGALLLGVVVTGGAVYLRRR